MNRSVIRDLVLFGLFLWLSIAVRTCRAEDPWDSYRGWSGVDNPGPRSSWYLGIVGEGSGIYGGRAFLKWYKYDDSTANMRPNHWRINSAELSAEQGTKLEVCRGLYYQELSARGMWWWKEPSQSRPSLVLAGTDTLLNTKNPQSGEWLGKVDEVRIFGSGYVESKYITKFEIVDEVTGEKYAVGGKEKYKEYVENGILLTNIQEGKHKIRPEVTVKTSFSEGAVDGAYKDFYLTFANNKPVTFYVDRHDPVAVITEIKNSDGTPGFPGPEDSNITYIRTSTPVVFYSLSDNLSSLGSFKKADAYLEWNDENGNPRRIEKMNFRNSWGSGSLNWEELNDYNIPGGKRYTVSIVAFDKAENVASEVETFYLDTHQPECSINSVQIKDGSYLRLEGYGEPYSVYELYVRNSEGKDILLTDPEDWSTYEAMSSSRYRVNGTGKWDLVIAAEKVKPFVQKENALILRIKSRDYAQNEYVSNYYEFSIDLKPPALNWEVAGGGKTSGIISDTDPAHEVVYFNTDLLTVKATAWDESGIEKIYYLSDLSSTSQIAFSDLSFPTEVSVTFDVGPFPEGKEYHWLRIYAVDRTGWSSTPHVLNFVVDKTPPEKPVLTSAPCINGNTIELLGKGEPGCEVQVYEKESLLGFGSVYTDGGWRIEIDNLSLGNHSLTLHSRDRAGNISISDEPLSLTILVRRPSPPIITYPQNGQLITDTYMPTFKGKATPGGIVELYDNGVIFGECQVNDDGKFNYRAQSAFSDGYHSLTARVYKDGAMSKMSERIQWRLKVEGFIGKQNLLIVAPDEVVEDSDFCVAVYDKETGKPVPEARVVFLGREYFTDEKGRAGSRGSSFRPGVVACRLKDIREGMQGPALSRNYNKKFKGEVKMATLFVEKGGKSADKDIAIKKGYQHKFGTFNKDGTNDRVYFSDPEDYPILIYDRTGRKVRTLMERRACWDGLDDNGNKVKAGVYIYQTRTGKTGTILVRR